MTSRSLHRLIVAAVGVLGLGLLPAAASAALTSPETLFIDTYRASGGTVTGPVSTSDVLTPGAFYAIEAAGRFATYLPQNLTPPPPGAVTICGTPQGQPTLVSPGKGATPTNADPEYVFATGIPGPCKPAYIGPTNQLEVNLGTGFGKLTANGAPFSAPRADHTYVYLVQGAGVPASIRYTDAQLSDNNGVITVTVRPATTTDCNGNTACLATAAAAATTPPASSTTGSSGFATTTPKRCISRRNFRIRIRSTSSDPVVAATVTLRGKAFIAQQRKGRLVANVDLRGLPTGSFSVTIVARTKSGKILRGKRTYKTCAPKETGSIPTL